MLSRVEVSPKTTDCRAKAIYFKFLGQFIDFAALFIVEICVVPQQLSSFC